MKKVLAILAIGVASFTAQAQTKFSAGLELGMPMGDFKDAYGFGFGASAKALFPMGGEKNGLTGSVGFMSFSGKSYDFGFGVSGTYPSTTAIPVKVGYRIGFDGGFYVEPQVGMTFLSGSGESTSGFTYAPNVGYSTGNLDFALRYEGASVTGGTFSHLGLRAAYSFGGGK